MKGVGTSVTAVIQDVIDGSFNSDQYVGTLENNGTLLAPYHDFESKVDSKLKDEVEALGAAIITGDVKVSK